MAEVDVKEALAALDWLETSLAPVRASDAAELAKVRACLQSVAQEREDWRAIEEWNMHPRHLATMNFGVGKCTFMLTKHDPYYNPTSTEFEAPTRAEAVSNAATWCRAEMAK